MTSSNPDPHRRSESSMPDDAGNGMTKQKIKEDTRDAKREAGTKAREKAEAVEKYDEVRESARSE